MTGDFQHLWVSWMGSFLKGLRFAMRSIISLKML